MVSELRDALLEGRVEIPQVGAVVAGRGQVPPFIVVDAASRPVEPALRFLRDLALSDVSPWTCRSYGFALSRWFRLLWLLDVEWDRATEAEVVLLVGWLRTAVNPQRRRHRQRAPEAGTVNPRTGKQLLKPGYAPRTMKQPTARCV